jgi:PilZ domain-containing protein
MRRLREHQVVTIEIQHSPPASIRCQVVAVEGSQAMLDPIEPGQDRLVSTEGRKALLVFEYRSQLITLRGEARRDDLEGGVWFAVTDSVMVPQRRRYARVQVALPVSITPLVGDEAALGAQVETQTRDVSADGLLIEELLPTSEPRLQIALQLPDRGPPITCEAQIVRHVGGGTALRFTNLGAEDRGRLKQFVATRKRLILEHVRKRDGG